MSSRHARRISTRLPYLGALTIANAITDVTRLAGVEGDGAAYPDSSVGVWPAATNLVTNGGFETNTTGWTGFGSSGETIERTTNTYKFGSACLKVTLGGIVGYDGATTGDIALTNGAAYTASAWVKCETGTINLRLRVVNTSYASIGQATFTATTSWQRVTVTVTATADTPFRVQVLNNTGGVSTAVYYVDGVQLETGSIATPYIETDGGTASRVAGDCYASTFSSLVNPTKGWMIVRGRFGVSDAAAPAGAYNLIECSRADGTSRVTLSWTPNNDQLNAARVGGGSSGSLGGTTVLTPALGDYVTGGMGWSASLIGTAANGNAFNTAANATIGGAFDRINFGSRRSGSPFYGDILWAVIGSEDTWDTALSVLMHSFGNNDPLPHQIPRRYGPVVLATMNGDGTPYRYSA